jgi:hypothetical protein
MVSGIASTVVVGDLNGDGLPDLVFSTPDGRLGASIATSLGNFSAPVYSTALATDFVDIIVQDIDGDGHLDGVALSDVTSGNATGKNVVFVLGSGGESFGTPANFAIPGAVALLTADLDEDGHLDVLALSGSPANITWLRGQAGGTLVAEPVIASPVENALSFVASDVNGDGHVDLVIGGDTLRVLLGDGHGTFTDGAALLTTPATVKVVVGDADGDGVPEVFAANADSVVRVFRVTNGALAPAGVFAAGGFLTGLLGADFNGDHLVDLISVGSKVALLLNDTK